MKKHDLMTSFKAIGLSLLLISGLSQNKLQAAVNVVPANTDAMSDAWAIYGLRFGIKSTIGQIAWVNRHAARVTHHNSSVVQLLLNPLAAESVVISRHQYNSNQNHGLKPVLKHLMRNALLLQLFEIVQTVVNQDPFLSDERLTMGHSAVFKDIAVIIAISIALEQYISGGIIFKNVLVETIKIIVEKTSGIIKFLFNQLRTMSLQKRLALLGTSTAVLGAATASLYYGEKIIFPIVSSFTNDLFQAKVLSELGLPSNHRLDRDIETLTLTPKRLLNQSVDLINLHKRDIKIIAYRALYFLVVQINQFLEPFAAMCSI